MKSATLPDPRGLLLRRQICDNTKNYRRLPVMKIVLGRIIVYFKSTSWAGLPRAMRRAQVFSVRFPPAPPQSKQKHYFRSFLEELDIRLAGFLSPIVPSNWIFWNAKPMVPGANLPTIDRWLTSSSLNHYVPICFVFGLLSQLPSPFRILLHKPQNVTMSRKLKLQARPRCSLTL